MLVTSQRFESAIEQLRAKPQFGYQQVSFAVEACELLAWLNQQLFNQRGYWRNKQGEAAALVGLADSVDSERALHQLGESLDSNDHSLRFYGGIAFQGQSATWPGFPQQRFVLPRFELRHTEGEYRFIINANFRHNPGHELDCIRCDFQNLRQAADLPNLQGEAHSRRDMPDKARWNNLIQQVTSAKFQQHTAKVVLARQTKYALSQKLNPFSLLQQWQAQEPDCFSFLLQFDGLRSFLGCSPERMYHRQGAQLRTEALAGTAARAEDPSEDQRLGDSLLNDEKNQRENLLVLDDLTRRLRELSLHVSCQQDSKLIKLSRVQHLKRPIEAKINPDLDDIALLKALHPTPAVGGLPRSSALRFILKHEGFSRGWYAGAVGWFSGAQSEFAVAIRSALLSDNELCLFAGAGIVEGSEAELEWQELNHKIATVSSLVNGS